MMDSPAAGLGSPRREATGRCQVLLMAPGWGS